MGESMSGQVASCSHRFSPPLRLRVGTVGLIALLTLSGCTTASNWPGASPTPVSPTAATSPGQVQSPAAATTATTPAQVQPPAAPTALHEWVDETSSRSVPAYFEWTPPTGTISGYYFWIKGAYTSDVTPPPSVCGPKWEKLPASATTLMMESVQAEPNAFICAYNDAGTSPTVEFPQDTPWAAAQPTIPGAPAALDAYLDATGGGTYPAELLDWVGPLERVTGFYIEIWHGGGDIPAPTACDPSWTKLAASARTYTIPAVEELPSVFICAFNDAGISPMVKFPTPEQE